MTTSKFKWIRLALVVLMGILAFGPLAHTQRVKAVPPSTGVACTTGASPNPVFSLTAQAG